MIEHWKTILLRRGDPQIVVLHATEEAALTYARHWTGADGFPNAAVEVVRVTEVMTAKYGGGL